MAQKVSAGKWHILKGCLTVYFAVWDTLLWRRISRSKAYIFRGHLLLYPAPWGTISWQEYISLQQIIHLKGLLNMGFMPYIA